MNRSGVIYSSWPQAHTSALAAGCHCSADVAMGSNVETQAKVGGVRQQVAGNRRRAWERTVGRRTRTLVAAAAWSDTQEQRCFPFHPRCGATGPWPFFILFPFLYGGRRFLAGGIYVGGSGTVHAVPVVVHGVSFSFFYWVHELGVPKTND
jgi:hypothetical protein